MLFDGKRILITGGTGSLGNALLSRLLDGKQGTPERIVIFSRDEAKQSVMRQKYAKYNVYFQIGDIRDYASVITAIQDTDIIFNAAALKQVPTCEYAPYEAVLTNIQGAENIIRAIQQRRVPVETVIGISTDKAAKPVNSMGFTKAIQERLFLSADKRCPGTRFVCVRYGNVLASRGSVIPLFKEQIEKGDRVTLTTAKMTRFLLSLDDAVDTVFAAVANGEMGDTFIPKIPSARIMDVAKVMIGERRIPIRITGIRPGEKIHEILISEEELRRTFERGKYYVIRSIFYKIGMRIPRLTKEFSSEDVLLDVAGVTDLLNINGLL